MLIKELVTNQAGTEEIKTDKDGKYKLEIIGDCTEGSFKIDYKTE
ncbi:hypothetical protein [Paenibacillus glacialis]|nr:hypothetical protein [Paenibacillus glacialis]